MMNTQTKPVFYDPKRRRIPVAMALGLLFSIAATLFCVSLAVAPLLPAVHLPHPRFIHIVWTRPGKLDAPQGQSRGCRLSLNQLAADSMHRHPPGCLVK